MREKENVRIMWLFSGESGRSVPKMLGHKIGDAIIDYLMALNFGALAETLGT